ncbi:MAG: polyprenyl synthetase family protein, partial [Pseudomonadota bacterium]|nr:polyprenyl synthetase family protein [Pseudomonadota bacterium]
MPDPTTAARLAQWRARVEATLAAALPGANAGPGTGPVRLHAAMRHAVLDGGKRMRPLLVHATGDAFGCDPAALEEPAAAVELIHAYSLVHDDLPAMDDDALRRGKPTVHVAFDEATAILAGDALQSLAFELLARAPLPAQARVEMLA